MHLLRHHHGQCSRDLAPIPVPHSGAYFSKTQIDRLCSNPSSAHSVSRSMRGRSSVRESTSRHMTHCRMRTPPPARLLGGRALLQGDKMIFLSARFCSLSLETLVTAVLLWNSQKTVYYTSFTSHFVTLYMGSPKGQVRLSILANCALLRPHQLK